MTTWAALLLATPLLYLMCVVVSVEADKSVFPAPPARRDEPEHDLREWQKKIENMHPGSQTRQAAMAKLIAEEGPWYVRRARSELNKKLAAEAESDLNETNGADNASASDGGRRLSHASAVGWENGQTCDCTWCDADAYGVDPVDGTACSVLESAYNCNCLCSDDDSWITSDECPATCFGRSCDEWHYADGGDHVSYKGVCLDNLGPIGEPAAPAYPLEGFWGCDCNGCMCDSTPENTGCEANCFPADWDTPASCDYIEMWGSAGYVEETKDNGVCDIMNDGDIIPVVEFVGTGASTLECNCTGCHCDGTMDYATSDFRACAAGCGRADNEAKPGYYTCQQWHDWYGSSQPAAQGQCTMAMSDGTFMRVDEYWNEQGDAYMAFCDCTGCDCHTSADGCYEQYWPDATTTTAMTPCTSTGRQGYEDLGYTCTDGGWCVSAQAVGACVTDCGGCATYYPNLCPNYGTGRCEECPDIPPRPTGLPTPNPSGSCLPDCGAGLWDCDTLVNEKGYTCLNLEEFHGCSCDGCLCGETSEPSLAPSTVEPTATRLPSEVPSPAPSFEPTEIMTPDHAWDFRGCESDVGDQFSTLVAQRHNGATCSAEGMVFDGIDDWLDVDDWTWGGTLSIEVYFKYDTLGGWRNLFDFGNGEDDKNVLVGSPNDPNTLGLFLGGHDTAYKASNVLEAGTWVHIVVTLTESEVTVTKDGLLVMAQEVEVSDDVSGAPIVTKRADHWIGKSHWETQPNFHGTIAYLRLWHGVALTPDMASHLNAAKTDTTRFTTQPSSHPTDRPTPLPTTDLPTHSPTQSFNPTRTPTTSLPSPVPSSVPSQIPTALPSSAPTPQPTAVPVPAPTISPVPSLGPTTSNPTMTVMPTVVPTSGAALDKLYKATSGDSWTSSEGWFESTDPCFGDSSWYGISCSDSAAVTAILLGKNGLQGTIPTELGTVSSLTSGGSLGSASMFMRDSNLYGSLPTQVGYLSSFKRGMDLRLNQITGSLPTELGNLREFEEGLYLRSNAITGTIPTELAQMTKFTFDFDLTKNSLCGPLATELSTLYLQFQFPGDSYTITEGNALGDWCPTPSPTSSPSIPPTPKPSLLPTPMPTATCDFGTYFDEGNGCVSCPVGTFGDTRGATSCLVCGAGKVAAVAGLRECTLCPTGRFLSDTGQSDASLHDSISDCESCPFPGVASASRTVCIHCVQGEEADEASGKCRGCARGRYAGLKDVFCKPCLVGKYAPSLNSTECISCSKEVTGRTRSTQGEGAVACDACVASYYLTNSREGRGRRGTWGFDNDETERSHCVPDVEDEDGEQGNACCLCPPGALCPGPTTLESLVIESKHWRYGSASATVLPCGKDYPQACTGVGDDNAANETFGDYLCDVGFTGVLCSSCEDNHYRDAVTRACMSCGDEQRNAGPTIAVMVMVIVNLMIYIPKMTGPIKRLYLKYSAVVNYGAILLITWQIVVNLSTVHVAVGGAGYPDLFRRVVGFLEAIVMLDIFEVLHLDCFILETDFFAKLLVLTLIPIAITALVMIVESLRYACGGGHPLRGKAFKWLITFVYFLLPMNSTTIISGLTGCKDFDTGTAQVASYMRVDMSIECGTSYHEQIEYYATIMCFVYPIGVPLVMFLLLFNRRSDISTRVTRDGDASLSSLSLLFGMYSKKMWWMVIADFFRRLALSSLLLWMPPAEQLLAASAIGVSTMVACREGAPFFEPQMSRVYYACGWVIVLCILALRLEDLQMFQLESAKVDGDIISAALILTNLGVLVLIFVSADFAGRAMNEGRLSNLIDELVLAEGDDKVAFIKAWETLMEEANSTEEMVRAKIQALDDTMFSHDHVKQTKKVTSLSTLHGMAVEHKPKVEKALKKMAESFGAEFHEGRVKLKQEMDIEVNDKALGYNRDTLRVVDPIPGMAVVFSNLKDFFKCIEALTDGGRDDAHVLQRSERKRLPRVLFVTDNVTVPLDTGYRQLKLNLTVPGTERLVVELTLHFSALYEREPMAARIQMMIETAGFSKEMRDEARKRLLHEAMEQEAAEASSASSLEKVESRASQGEMKKKKKKKGSAHISVRVGTFDSADEETGRTGGAEHERTPIQPY